MKMVLLLVLIGQSWFMPCNKMIYTTKRVNVLRL